MAENETSISMPQPVIRARHRAALVKGSTLIGFDEVARREGADPQRLLTLAGLSDIYLRRPELYLPFYNFMNLLEIAARETGNLMFGAELGLYQGIRVFGSIARLLETSATVGDALAAMLQHYMLHTTGAELGLNRIGKSAILSAVVNPPVPPGCRQIHNQLCGTAIAIMRPFLGPDWMAEEFHFACPAPGQGVGQGVARYHEIFGPNIRFGTIRSAAVFDADLLAVPLPDADPALHRLIEGQLNELALNFAENLPQQVEATIINEMAVARVNIEHVARALAISPRSLQRHLSYCGTSFSDVLDRARKQTAEHYLSSTSLSLTEIASLLGFGGLSNFSHAFQRWHGGSASAWRRENTADDRPHATMTRLAPR